MDSMFAVLGFLGFVVGVIWVIIAKIKKNPIKIPLIVLCSGVVLFFVGAAIGMNNMPDTATNTTTVAPIVETTTADTTAETTTIHTTTKAPVEIPKYSISNSSEYVRDGKKCVGYRVVIDAKVTDEQLKLAYKSITKNDGYYLHTVWFYGSNKEVEEGPYTVAMMEEETEGGTPIIKR